jgi:threonine/homoserine/homoserine lactone efflux protein
MSLSGTLLPLLIGFAFGYIGSMPVAGPISVLVLHLGLAHDPRHALYVAVGGALAEGLYALLAFWGLSTMLARYPMVLPGSRAAGAAILMALGLVMLLRKVRGSAPAGSAPAGSATSTPRTANGNKRSFALGFLITAINPTLLVTWTAAVTGLNATGLLAMDRSEALPFAVAACIGIVAWFLTLLWLVAKWRSRLSLESMGRVMKGMGATLVGLGAWMAIRALHKLLR